MLYRKSREARLTDELFANPGYEYRGAPFWAWNCKLDAEEIDRQVDVFDEMGLGGFHMHVRTGLDTPYLSEEYMARIRRIMDDAGVAFQTAELGKVDAGGGGTIVSMTAKESAKIFSETPRARKRA